MRIKQKSENKIKQMNIDTFLNQNFLDSIDYLFQFIKTKIRLKILNTRKQHLPEGIIKNYNMIINGKNFYDQAIDSDIKRYEEIRKLITQQGEDYTTGCLLDYDYIKNHYRLIRQKELDADAKAIQQIEFV